MFGLFNGSNNDIVDDIEAVLRPMAGMAIAKKFALHDIVGDVETWQADLESAVLLLDETEFHDIQIIGTYAFDDGTWLWAWGNQGSDFAKSSLHLENSKCRLLFKGFNAPKQPAPIFAVFSKCRLPSVR